MQDLQRRAGVIKSPDRYDLQGDIVIGRPDNSSAASRALRQRRGDAMPRDIQREKARPGGH